MLARTGYATGPVQAALARAGIPHRVLGSLGLYERSEVRDALAYLTLIANPPTRRRSIARSARPRGVGTATADRVITSPVTDTGRPDRRQRHARDESIRPPAGARARRFGRGLERPRELAPAARSGTSSSPR